MTDFSQRLVDTFDTLGLALTEAHGLRPAELDEAEKRLGVALPRPLRQYYLLAGRHPINNVHDDLLSPDDLSFDGDVLAFMNENQSVVVWGIPASAFTHDDPPVLQAPTGGDLEWYPEDESLTNFLITMIYWHAVNGGLPFVAVSVCPVPKLDPEWTLAAGVHELTAHHRGNAVLCVMKGSDDAQVHLGSTDRATITAVGQELGISWDYSTLEDEPEPEGAA